MKRFIKVILVLSALALIGVACILGMVGWIASDLPQINSLADYKPPSNSKILARDKTVLLEIGKETRDVVPFKEIPKRIVDAFLAAEDDNFWHHNGVDYLGIARAFMVNLKEGRLVQGGSTITQQVAKSLLLSKERSLSRKVKDFLLAQKIEEKFSKEDILFLYLNQVYLGGGYYGVKSAMKGYFDKDLAQATVAESALVAGLLVAPGKYSPYNNPHYAKMRQQYVLRRMFDTGKITQAEFDAAKTEEIKMRLRSPNSFKGGHFTEWIRQKVVQAVGEEEFLTEGFEVVTTLDWTLQQKAEQSLMTHVKELDKRQGFSGPLGRLADQAAVDEELQRSRKSIYGAASTYFHFAVDGTNRFEFSLREGEWETLQSYYREEEEKLNTRAKKDVVVGNGAKDTLLTLLPKGKTFSAIILKVDDPQKMIYASIGGTRVVIPESGFSWAHPRKLDEEPKWFAPVSKPSTILKPNDQILVRITGDNQGIWPLLSNDFKKRYTDASLVKVFQSQKFVVAELDQKPEAEGSFVALDPRSGQVLTMVGGVDFVKSKFNRALQAARQPGSSFKPFIYAAALEEGYTPSTILLDTPQALGGNSDALSWKPRNYDGEFMGQMTFRKALEVSRNIPTIRILQDIGVNKMSEFVNRFGLNCQLPKDMSIGLGSFGISLAELVRGYATFANGGRKVNLRMVTSIKDRNGKTFKLEPDEPKAEPAPAPEVPAVPSTEETPPLEAVGSRWKKNLSETQVYDPQLSFVMTRLLEGVIQSGTATAAAGISPNIAGKTGTTNNYVDALFVGYSSTVVAGAWIGFDDNRPLGYGETGGKTALPVWSDFMSLALSKYGAPDFTRPEGVSTILVNKETGKPTGDGTGFAENFAEGMDPTSSPRSQQTATTPNEATKPTVLEDGDYYLNQ